MAEEKTKEVKEKKIEGKGRPELKIREESLVRILSTDIPGNKQLVVGLTRIKGISWGFSNAVCHMLKMDKKKKIKDLNEHEIKTLSEFIKNPKVPTFLLNRRRDFETGENKHIIGSDLDLQKEFDIKRLKKIRSYRGLRHALGQPTRGQRTRSHFRAQGKKVRKAIGVMSKPSPGKK